MPGGPKRAAPEGRLKGRRRCTDSGVLGGGSHISTQTPETEDELQDLDRKIKQLKLDYERYFLGTRPREPFLLRSEVQKTMAILSNTAIQNTALRFKFSSICSRYQALKRQWDETLRKIEAGTYARHRFKADLHERQRLDDARRALDSEDRSSGNQAPAGQTDLFADYRAARLACGQAVDGLTPAKLKKLLDKQRSQLAKRFGDDSEFSFRVVVEDGKAKVKARKVSAA